MFHRARLRSEGTTADAAPAPLALAWSSPGCIAIARLRDVLNLDNEAHMNGPGSATGNWGRRCDDRLLPPAIQHLRLLGRDSGRVPSAVAPASVRRVS
jgi:4-alpha-glucanotransferase